MNRRIAFFASLIALLGAATLAHADTLGLIPCGNVEAAGKVTDPCTYTDLIILAQTVIKFLIFSLAAPIAAIMFAYAGFTYITNGGNESKIKQAHDIFLMVFWGLVIALAAWLVVNFILVFLLGTGSVFNFLG
jgi:hypothetical protein